MADTPRQVFERSQERKRTARPRDLEGDYRARDERKAKRKAEGKPPRSEDATSIDEALEAEREAGRREGGGVQSPKPAAPRAVNISQYSGGSVPGVTAPMILDIMIITADELVNEHRLPIPSRLLVAFVLFGGLGLVKGNGARAASVFAWGIVVATFYTSATGGQSTGVKALDSLGKFLNPKTAAQVAPKTASTSGVSSGAPAMVA